MAVLAKVTKGKRRRRRDVVSLYIKQLSLVGVLTWSSKRRTKS